MATNTSLLFEADSTNNSVSWEGFIFRENSLSNRAPRDAGSLPSRPAAGRDGTAKMKIGRDGTEEPRDPGRDGTLH